MFSLEIIINYNYYYFISKYSLGIATFSTSPLAQYLKAFQIRLGNAVTREQKGPQKHEKASVSVRRAFTSHRSPSSWLYKDITTG